MTQPSQSPDKVVDASGLMCPLPVIKAAEALKQMLAGDTLELISTDPGVIQDMQDWCHANRHDYLEERKVNGMIKIWVKKG